ncbi:MAG: ParB/RepB/Spo0J family partition protein [Candidatus Adiutrix sp.]|jgi:ParB family chromosome partitioning protein|nr:ParB/RepB/Spo0J family partition protein [Candidatus Adiutrix sp.]
MNAKKSRLGRGLTALVSPENLDDLHSPIEPTVLRAEAGVPLMLAVDMLDSNPDQPRRDFNEKELASLSQSIKAKGIIEPLVVSKKADGRYEIIAGERRLKAAKLANISEVPVIINKNFEEPSDRLVLALLENLCREDLNPIEEAESFFRLEKEFGKTHQEIAQLSGRERPTVTNTVRRLKLPEFVQDDVRFARLSAGHGRAMLALTDHSLFQQLRSEVISKSLTVRQTEALVKKLNRKPGARPEALENEAYFEALSQAFSHKLGGLKVKISHSGKNRKMEIFYTGNEDLELLMKKLGVEPV